MLTPPSPFLSLIQAEEPETSPQTPEYTDYEDYDGKLPDARTEASTPEEEIPQARKNLTIIFSAIEYLKTGLLYCLSE